MHRLHASFGVAMLAMLAISLPAIAGEADHEPDDTHEHGTPFFGEVKDIKSFSPVESVLVKFQVKGTSRFVISQTDSDGQFRRSGLGPEVDPETIEVSCEKPGFRTVEVMRRTMSKEKHAAVEVECLLEKR